MTAADPDRMLDAAEGVLSGAVSLPRGRGVRITAVLARSALEDVVVRVCADHGVDVGETSMRVKLATLIALSEPRAGDLAMAWWSLSRACHQHAYEIAPNHGEVADLVERVRQVKSSEAGAS